MDLAARLSFYVIPDREIGAPVSILNQAEEAVRGGASAIQLRDKTLPGRELYDLALQLKKICSGNNVLFIVNDRLDIAMASGADGVHVGQSDLSPRVVRELVSDGFVVGVSARTPEDAERAVSNGADYLGVGAVFPTNSKSDARVIGLNGLKEIVFRTEIPVVAIGGIKPDTIPLALKAGAKGVAVISSVIGRGRTEEDARNIRETIDQALK